MDPFVLQKEKSEERMHLPGLNLRYLACRRDIKNKENDLLL